MTEPTRLALNRSNHYILTPAGRAHLATPSSFDALEERFDSEWPAARPSEQIIIALSSPDELRSLFVALSALIHKFNRSMEDHLSPLHELLPSACCSAKRGRMR